MSRRVYQKTYSPYEETQLIVQDELAKVNTIMPCKVTLINGFKVNVQPLINRIYIDDNQTIQYIPYGVVSNIPVLTLGNNQFNISFPPPTIGDVGLLLVNQNQVSAVYSRTENNSPRKFDITDGVYIPLFMNTSVQPNDKITINTAQKFNIKNNNYELIAALVEIFNAILNLTTQNTGDVLSAATKAAIMAALIKIQSFE